MVKSPTAIVPSPEAAMFRRLKGAGAGERCQAMQTGHLRCRPLVAALGQLLENFTMELRCGNTQSFANFGDIYIYNIYVIHIYIYICYIYIYLQSTHLHVGDVRYNRYITCCWDMALGIIRYRMTVCGHLRLGMWLVASMVAGWLLPTVRSTLGHMQFAIEIWLFFLRWLGTVG